MVLLRLRYVKLIDSASNRYLLNKSQWVMVSGIRKGKSVDNGFYERKNPRVIRHNQLPANDKVFSAFIHEYGREPVDEQAIFRITLQRLFQRLSDQETRYIRHKAVDGLSDTSISRKMGITFTQLREMKGNIRRQIEPAFAA